ncbi:hypothetical protein HH110_06285 [Stenotrophomonas sp. SAM-B]|uniref:hypothetical protein n=1 Tax=Stenotrophomonas sp. SAM-B TaxID=2729141 RepID=UPI0015A0A584|nr:hypothetical protein [Stenotrophomonas sp. SAM-B]NWF32650.1 hypothetical protein [Stenotrophomonas sp. SAM-B]
MPKQSVVIDRRGRANAAGSLDLGQDLGRQVVAGVVLIVLLQQRQYRAGHLLAVQRLVVEVAIAVLGRMGQQALLSAQNLVMQLVAHEVDDHPAV